MAIQQFPDVDNSIGLHEATALAGHHLLENISKVTSMDPALSRSLIKNGFGDSLALSGVEYREYALRTIAMLITMGGCEDQIGVYLEAALLHGATEAEVLSIVDQASQYVGFPRAVNALRYIAPRLEEARKHPSLQERIITLSDHETLVRDTDGPGIPIVLIHALCMDGLMFQKLIPSLISLHPNLRIIAYDIRGHGRARGAPLTRNISHLVSDLNILLNKLDIPKADIVGSSFGGAIAEEFAVAHPERVRALCPMATGGKGNPVLLSRATRALNGEMDALRTESIIRWFLPETIADNTWAVRYARNKLDHVTIPEWAAAWKAMAEYDALEKLKLLDIPVLVLCGSKDLSATPEQMKPIHQVFIDAGKSNSEYVEIPNGTHMMPMEQNGEVAKALTTWRTKVDGL